MLKVLKQKAKQLKREIYTLIHAYSHPGVPWYTKLFLLLIIIYALSPIDIIPDFIPVLGLLDDLILIPLGVLVAMKMIPPSVWSECRLKADVGLDINKSYGLYGAGIIIIFWLIVGAWALKTFLAYL